MEGGCINNCCISIVIHTSKFQVLLSHVSLAASKFKVLHDVISRSFSKISSRYMFSQSSLQTESVGENEVAMGQQVYFTGKSYYWQNSCTG